MTDQHNIQSVDLVRASDIIATYAKDLRTAPGEAQEGMRHTALHLIDMIDIIRQANSKGASSIERSAPRIHHQGAFLETIVAMKQEVQALPSYDGSQADTRERLLGLISDLIGCVRP